MSQELFQHTVLNSLSEVSNSQTSILCEVEYAVAIRNEKGMQMFLLKLIKRLDEYDEAVGQEAYAANMVHAMDSEQSHEWQFPQGYEAKDPESL